MEKKQHNTTAWVKYLNDDGQVRHGDFKNIVKAERYLSFETLNGSIITIPWERLIKLKEKTTMELDPVDSGDAQYSKIRGGTVHGGTTSHS